MSSDLAVAIRGVGKEYRLGVSAGFGQRHTVNRPTTAAEAIMRRVRHPIQRETPDSFWALRDIDIELHRGDVLGLLGRNGAGKTTLLKLLSRITTITEGRIDIYGRVGSLLEVGTGFNLELTGRENIYLNGAILGMRKSEISREFDAIVDFSGVEQFLDTPVKRYSTGMAVRLAFSVAAHLQTDILLVDEVLSVGDQAFREKCLGKLGDVAGAGRTVIYVSHLMETVTHLCTRAVLLESGRLRLDGGVDEAVTAYIARQSETTDLREGMDNRPGDGTYRFVEAVPDAEVYAADDEKTIMFSIERKREGFPYNFYVAALFVDERETVVAHLDSRLLKFTFQPGPRHRGRVTLKHPWLRPGRYRVDLRLMRPGGLIDEAQGACFIEVLERLPYPGVIGRQAGQAHLSAVFSDFSFESDDPWGAGTDGDDGAGDDGAGDDGAGDDGAGDDGAGTPAFDEPGTRAGESR